MKDIGLLNEVIDHIRLRHLPDEMQKDYEYFHLSDFSIDGSENADLLRYLKVIRRYSFKEINQALEQKLIVSLTSFPPRMETIPKALDSVLDQTVKADEVILWLAAEQYPADTINEQLAPVKEYVDTGKITLRWCDDLRPHKKYYFAMQEYPDALIVTIDDDVIYEKHVLEYLLLSYLEYPDCVSALRTHIISMKEGRFLPYSEWLKNTDILLNKPSHELIAIGCGGILYPPHLFTKELFSKDVIMDTCLNGDDLWLKAMELISDIPVVLAHYYPTIKNTEQHQKSSLQSANVDQNGNDQQLASIKEWIDQHHGKDHLEKILTDYEDPHVCGVTKISSYFQDIVDRNNERLNKLRNFSDKYHVLQEENEKLKKELQKIKDSRSYKLANQIRKVIK